MEIDKALIFFLNFVKLLEDTADIDDDRYSRSAVALYGLIHSRFILTSRGLDKMVSYLYFVLRASKVHSCNYI